MSTVVFSSPLWFFCTLRCSWCHGGLLRFQRGGDGSVSCRTSSIELGNRGGKGGGPTHLRKGSGHYNGPSHGGDVHVHVDRGEVKGSGSGGGSGYGNGEGTPMLRGIDETGTHFVIDDEE